MSDALQDTIHKDVIHIGGQYYIHSKSSMADSRTLVLKHGETFAVFDRHGDIHDIGYGEQGIFHEGTRFLSHLVLSINDERPLLLSSAIRRDDSILVVDLTNPDLNSENNSSIPQDTLHILRSKFLWQGVCYERLTVSNFHAQPISIQLAMDVGADFADIFEVRGEERSRRGQLHHQSIDSSSIRISYTGLDDVTRVTHITSTPPPDVTGESNMAFNMTLDPGEERSLDLSFAFQVDSHLKRLTHDEARRALHSFSRRCREGCIEITTANEQFNDWINQSLADLHMLTTETDDGLYPYAGIPWFSTAFGRDGIITALQTLWAQPDLARGVLSFLARTQATEEDPARDAEPGKILHETRGGEMAATGEIPFQMYYGSVDSTPLFVVLAANYYDATGDREFIASIWPNIQAALGWIENYGDLDGDGFVEYKRKQDTGLFNQGWKDSSDSIFHADGSLAEPPIAVCEMQAYVYAARIGAAKLAGMLGHHALERDLQCEAAGLREKFEEHFWDEELGTYVLALDGDKQPCRVVSSNAGHALFAGIASEERAERVARTLLSDDSYSGWGIRTASAGSSRYNPMSYHNGSVWPHDNALIADGLARYGHQDMAAEVMTGLFNVSNFMDQQRLPELFCGFSKGSGQAPTLYPVACSPQAWAAGAVFMLLSSCLGLRVNAADDRLSFIRPLLPRYLDHVNVRNLRVGPSTLDLNFHRYPDDVGISVVRRTGPVEVMVVK
jgi:glycogen debranching enzyme